MVEDATLNDFQSAADDPPTENTAESAIDPATITFTYSPDGAACEACGAIVERRWILEGTLVCPSCMEW